MSIDPVISIGWDFSKWIVVPIKRQFKYVISSKSYALGLKEEVRTLEFEVGRVQRIVDEANNNLRSIHLPVKEWQASARNALKEAQDLEGDFERVSKTCCYGALPDPIIRYRFSRKAKETIEDIQKLAENGKEFKEMNNISCSGSPPGRVASLTPAVRVGKDVVQSTPAAASASSISTSIELQDDGIFESRASIIRKIMDALADSSNRVVGIHGMGGVGKSTLLVHAERRIREKKSFDWVAKADVSKNPDIKRIQEEIAHDLGLDFRNEEFVSVRARLLCKRLEEEEKNKKMVLIILDNLYERLDLKSVGIPCRHDNKVEGCKLLLTSRDLKILQSGMGCDDDFHLGGLQEGEARGLFEKTVGPKVHDEEFKPCVKTSLHQCAGVPFLIVAMANRLKNAELNEWKDTLSNIEKSIDKNINELIDYMLQGSYEKLEEEVKLLLQLCVVYDISKPSLENLPRYGLGLRIFERVTNMEEARNRLSSHIHTLQASSLLLESEDVESFKIHDLVREFVENVASKDHPLLVWKDKNELITELPIDKLKRCKAICFPFVDMKELPELDCPELLIFFLFTNNRSLSLPESYFNSMRKLMVLQLRGLDLTRLPLPFRSLENLHCLCLNGCVLDDVATLGELKGLEILSLAYSKIQRLPKEIGNLVELRLLDLNYCRKLRTIEPSVLGRMMKLDELYVLNSFSEWEQTPRTNASLVELNNKKNLRTLHVYIPDPSILPEDHNFEKLTKYKIQIGRVEDRWRRVYKGIRTLDLKLNPTDDIIQKGRLQATFDRSDELFLDGLNVIDQSICELSQEGFPKLNHLHVQDSPSIHYILRQPTALKTLKSLVLGNLVNLKKISNDNVSSNSFSALEVVRVDRCGKMQALFPFSVVRELPQLKKMEVVDCASTQGIVEAGNGGKVKWPNLRELILHNLPYMKTFFISGTAPSSSTSADQNGVQVTFFNGQQVVFPNLETLEIVAMDNIEMIWDNHVNFGHLKTLHVSHCDKLSHIFTSTIVGNLVELTRLTINECKILTEVIVDERGEESCVVAFKRLKYLELNELTRLRCFNSGGHTLMFPLLEDVIVIECHNMKVFSDGPIEAPKLQGVHVTKLEVFWKENLNITIQYIYEEMAVAGLRKLWLSEFPELIEKWHNKLIPIKSSWKLSSLVVDKCPSFVNAIPSKLILVLENLLTLQVCNCELLEEIFDLEGLDGVKSTQVLASLRNLNLVNLPRLRQLGNNDLQGRLCFNRLERLSLYKCGDLKYVFLPSVAQSLETLKWMEIKECGHMECVISEEEGQGSAIITIKFLTLREMTLERLPKLTSFLSGKKHTSEFPRLKNLTITHCPKIRSLIGQSLMETDQANPSLFPTQVQFPQLSMLVLSHMDSLSNIWTNGLPETHIFKKLGKVEVHNCKSLEYLFPHWFANSLNNLGRLRVESSEFEERIMSTDDTPHSTATQFLFPKLTSLVLHEIPRLRNFCPNLSTWKLSSLRELRVTHCHKLEVSFSVALMNKWTQRDKEQDLPNQEAYSSIEWDFPKLVKLQLDKDDIKRIQDGNLADEIYGKPIRLTLACFHDENDIFPSSSHLERFHNLRSLEIFCSSFEDIFLDDGPVEQHEYPVLENLQELKLSKLHNLRRVWRKDYLVSKIFQNIRSFEVWDCPGLTTLFPNMASFQNLIKLVVQNCSGVIHLLTVSKDTNLVHLREMIIIGCERMKEVMANDGNGEEKVVLFESLETLTLQSLPSLLCFSSDTSCVCEFPSLQKVVVEECPKMKTFSRGTLSMPNLQGASMFRYIYDMSEEGDLDLNTVIQKLSA